MATQRRRAYFISCWLCFLSVVCPFTALSFFPCSKPQNKALSVHLRSFELHYGHLNQTPCARLAAAEPRRRCLCSTKTRLHGWFQDLVPDFLKERQNDFVRLEESGGGYGPGPLILLYNVPSSIDDEEFRDMVSDGASIEDCVLHRIVVGGAELTCSSGDEVSALLDIPMEEALNQLTSSQSAQRPTISQQYAQGDIPSNGIIFFSGFPNNAMMEVYKIMSQEIYQETGGMNEVACAKAVPNAMQKPLRQVFEEINGDHQDALSQ